MITIFGSGGPEARQRGHGRERPAEDPGEDHSRVPEGRLSDHVI